MGRGGVVCVHRWGVVHGRGVEEYVVLCRGECVEEWCVEGSVYIEGEWWQRGVVRRGEWCVEGSGA